MEYALVGCRSLVALVFMVSVVSKLRSHAAYDEFVAATVRLSLRPVATTKARRLATAVVTAEVAIVALVVVPVTVPIGFAVAAALLTAFTGAILLALRRGERSPCRCFGSAEQPLGYPQVVRNLVLIATSTFGLVAWQQPASQVEPAGAILAVVMGALAAAVVVVIDDIASLLRPI